MKTANGVEKPLAEWTLKDLKKFKIEKCENFYCHECTIRTACHDEIEDWDLEEKPKFTEQEIEDAKNLMRIMAFTEIGTIKRDSNGNLLVERIPCLGDLSFYVSKELFPTIEIGETYTFAEIIGESND